MTSETAKWLKSREDWLRVVAIPSPHGGFDVALVIDGSYSLDAGPQRVVRGHAERLMAALAADGLPLGRPTPSQSQSLSRKWSLLPRSSMDSLSSASSCWPGSMTSTRS